MKQHYTPIFFYYNICMLRYFVLFYIIIPSILFQVLQLFKIRMIEELVKPERSNHYSKKKKKSNPNPGVDFWLYSVWVFLRIGKTSYITAFCKVKMRALSVLLHSFSLVTQRYLPPLSSIMNFINNNFVPNMYRRKKNM